MSVGGKVTHVLGLALKGWALYVTIAIIIAIILFLVIFFTVVYPTMQSAGSSAQSLQFQLNNLPQQTQLAA